MSTLPFGGDEVEPAHPESARFVLLPVPYERTTTYRKGTAAGPEALLRASAQVELFDEELRVDPLAAGVATLPPLDCDEAPEVLADKLETTLQPHLARGQIPGCLGGEHSISLGPIRAAARHRPGLGVLQIDAHPDLRDSYEGTRYGHGCVMRRVLDLPEIEALVPVGLRAVSPEEDELLSGPRVHPFYAHDLRRRASTEQWVGEVVDALPEWVYVTFDLDGLDPSIVPGTGTPEPGGLGWWETMTLLRTVLQRRRLAGFDVVELLPEPSAVISDFAAARVVMKILAYATVGLDG